MSKKNVALAMSRSNDTLTDAFWACMKTCPEYSDSAFWEMEFNIDPLHHIQWDHIAELALK